MSNWQPIETAPRNVELLLYYPALRAGRMSPGAMLKVGRTWDLPSRQPTHWMPLPEPPE
jgi:hypothetical protein